ncbi:MAG: GntR family transcriptional regulator [Nocardioides sp.]|uniref:GntR family transcriptional regulator n=1 Tax=Nocardioides sp. TaxID=35761 RepID=UPI003D6B7BC3
MATTSRPKHSALSDELRALVLNLPVGAALPPERQLAERWGVARMTVRQAIASLVQEGLVRTVHGRGNLRAPAQIPLRVRLGSFADALREHALEPSTRLLECAEDVQPPPPVQEFLPHQSLVRIERIRFGNDVPFALERAWLPADLVAGADEAALTGSLYSILEDRGVLPDLGEESVRADLPTLEEARLLDAAGSRPVLRLLRRASSGGRPVEYAEAVLPADRHELWFPLG